MKENLQAAREFLRGVQCHDGGWSYTDGRWPMADGRWQKSSSVGAQSYPEPTCYSVLALSTPAGKSEIRHGEGATRRYGDDVLVAASPRLHVAASDSDIRASDFSLERGLHWLESRVHSRGFLTLEGDDEPHWSTSLLVLTLSRLQQVNGECRMMNDELKKNSVIVHRSSFIIHRSVNWLLSWQGKQVEPKKEIAVNSQLRGWPWMSDTFSWVEPTSYAVLALKRSGQGNHPRVAEAERLLLDRACVGGGWNYGGRIALGHALTPFLPTTALAALALQDLPAASQIIDQSVALLRREVREHQSALSLALTVLCFNALGQPTDEFIHALLKRQKLDGSWRQAVHLTALAILALESVNGGSNVFKL